jgi:hypothetical protein
LRTWIAILNTLISSRFFITFLPASLRSFLFPAHLYSGRRHLHIYCAARNSETGRRIAARISWLDFRGAGHAVIRNRNRNGDLYSHRGPIASAPQALLVRTHNCLHRMSLRSIRDDSRDLTIVALSRESMKALFGRTQSTAA